MKMKIKKILNNYIMPYHTGTSRQEPKTKKKMNSKSKESKKMKMFSKMPPNSHLMNGNVIMSGKTHSKNSKVLGKLKK